MTATFDLLADIPDPTPERVKQARTDAGHSQLSAAKLVGLGAGQRWYEFESGMAPMDRARWALYLLAIGHHPRMNIKARSVRARTAPQS